MQLGWWPAHAPTTSTRPSGPPKCGHGRGALAPTFRIWSTSGTALASWSIAAPDSPFFIEDERDSVALGS